jgi:hypothetical protein
MNKTSFDFVEGQLVELYMGVPSDSWRIYDVPDDVLREALQWNDPDGDFEQLGRLQMLEVFLHDFVVDRK